MGDKSSRIPGFPPISEQLKKLKFQPKVPPQKKPKSAGQTMEPRNEVQTIDRKTLEKMQLTERLGGGDSKMPREKELAVTFGRRELSGPMSFGVGRVGVGTSSTVSNTDLGNTDDSLIAYEVGSAVKRKITREDPIRLPLRRPDSYGRSQEMLDEEEFGKGSEIPAPEMTSVNRAAEELGLMETDVNERLLIFQLPTTLPLIKAPPSEHANKKEGLKNLVFKNLNEHPEGFLGKMLVYKSGAVKMKIGDVSFDVSAGVDRNFSEEIAAIDTKEKRCCILGKDVDHAVVTADVNSIFDSL